MRFKKNSLPDCEFHVKFQLKKHYRTHRFVIRAIQVFCVTFNMKCTRQAVNFPIELDKVDIFVLYINIEKCIHFIINLNFGNNKVLQGIQNCTKHCLSVLRNCMNLEYHVKKAFFCPIHVAIDFLLLYLNVVPVKKKAYLHSFFDTM